VDLINGVGFCGCWKIQPGDLSHQYDFHAGMGTSSRFFEFGPYHIIYYAICHTLNVAQAVLLHKGIDWVYAQLGNRFRSKIGAVR